jgi:hypothetical protein
MKRRIGDNSDPSVAALWNKLNEAQELILKSINKTDEMNSSTKENSRGQFIFTEECFDLKEESADLSIDAANKIEEVLKEVESEK